MRNCVGFVPDSGSLGAFHGPFCPDGSAWQVSPLQGCVGFIDSTAALMRLVRGRSAQSDLERMAHLIHVILFSLQTWIYWEYIPSKSNWLMQSAGKVPRTPGIVPEAFQHNRPL